MSLDAPLDHLDHSCDAWPGNPSIIPNAEPKPYDQFYIDFDVRFTYPSTHVTDDDDFEEIDDYECITRSVQFWIPCDELICHNTSWSAVSDMLSSQRVPLHLQPFMICNIVACAQSMISDQHNLQGNKVLPMRVSIDVVVECMDYQEETVDATEARPVPANESSVEALEKVKVNNSGTRTQCVICLEELLVGSEVTQMPCSHLFHGDCIVPWLGVSNMCPLCRFQMPT